LQKEKGENRDGERRKINEMAWIVDPDIGNPIECTLRNLSVGGALIETAQPIDLPDYLFIILPGEDYAIECRASWASGRKIGVEFL